MAESTHQIRIIAQPKANHRERYTSESNRAQRFIRADDNPEKLEYPTIEIPNEWREAHRQYFVRVTLATVPYADIDVTCVHPYQLDTRDPTVRKDPVTNSLYFPITEEEFRTCRKSFKISRKKMLQHELKSYGPLRILDSNDIHMLHEMNPQDARQLIEKYRLWESCLVFSIAELSNGGLPIVLSVTTVFSQVTSAATHPANDDDAPVRYAPQRGNWHGGDEVLMVIPGMDKRKAFLLHFEYPSNPSTEPISIPIEIADTKTIVFRTPSCPVPALPDNQSFEAFIVGTQGEEEIVRVSFIYQSINLCSRCLLRRSPDDTNCQSNKKRSFEMFDDFENDAFVPQSSNLLSSKTPKIKSSPTDTDNKLSKLIGHLQEAVVHFVRTNDPRQLFRRLSPLVAEYKNNSPPLHDAIRGGHIELASNFIEQVINTKAASRLLEQTNQDGETLLLLAAKLNQWTLIKQILSVQPDLARQIDNHDNNLLHLLAAISNDDGHMTMECALSILSIDTVTDLISTPNKNDQTPVQVAEANQNIHCAQLLRSSVHS